MAIGAILGGFSLLIGMIALWLASDTSRRLNNQGQAFVDAHVGRIRSDMANLSKDIGELKRHIKVLQEKSLDMENRQADGADPETLQAELMELRYRLQSIEAIIPAKARQVQPSQQRM